MKRRQWSIVEEIVSSNAENPERADAAQLVRARSGHRYLVVLVMVLVMALTTLGACSPAVSTAVPETAVTAEIRQLMDDYVAAWNTYDADAMRALLTDGFMWYFTNPDPKHGVSTGAVGDKDLAETLSYVEGSAPLNKMHLEWVGEPSVTGDGPWLVSRAWHFTSANYDYPEVLGITTYTIVDEDGTLKIARAIEVGFKVEQLLPGPKIPLPGPEHLRYQNVPKSRARDIGFRVALSVDDL